MLKIRKIFFQSTQATQDELLVLFQDYYLTEQNFVRSSIYWMINSSDIDDLVQETFLKAWRSFERFESKSSFRTWIYRIARNVTFDYLKNNKKQTEELNEEHIESKSFDMELSDLIKKGLMLLPIRQREAFSLHYQVGLTYSEVSLLIGIPEGTVKSRASSAKVVFIEFLKQNGVNHE